MRHDLYQGRVQALKEVWKTWADLGTGLGETEWDRMSRCDGWTVASLFAHHSLFPLALAAPPPDGGNTGDAAVATAADILREFNVAGGAADAMAAEVGTSAVEDAGSVSHQDLVARFTVVGPQAIQNLVAADPGLLTPWPATSLMVRLVEAIRIVLMEASVHLLDVFDALGRQPSVPTVALQETAALLVQLADPVSFVEAATGRSTAAVLPVLR